MSDLLQPTADDQALPLSEVVLRITALNVGIRDFWSKAHGWAPQSAADLLARSRLDRQASLSSCLALWVTDSVPDDRREGMLVLGWANLGALVEGSLKWFLSVYRDDYPTGEDAPKRGRKGPTIEPEALSLEELRNFFKKQVWIEEERDELDSWISCVQRRRNAIHAYQDRELGDLNELHTAIREYLVFLRRLHGRVPEYPDDVRPPG